jgi:hypothetical protein
MVEWLKSPNRTHLERDELEVEEAVAEVGGLPVVETEVQHTVCTALGTARIILA